MTRLAALPARGIIAVEGEDRVSFLQGLVSNDVSAVAPGDFATVAPGDFAAATPGDFAAAGRAVWAALLTPQGKWLADFFILTDGSRLLLDCERAQIPMLVPRLSRFRLRAKVTVQADEALHVHAAWREADTPADGPTPAGLPEFSALDADVIVAADRRLPDAGWRVLAPRLLPTTAGEDDWDAHRLRLGLPDGSRDMETEKTVLLEAGFDELDGVSWTKGCYMGQELTARTKYRGLLKRRLVPVSIEGPAPPPGAPVFRGDAEVGVMRSARDGAGLAVLRLDALASELRCEGAMLLPVIPAWMRLPEAVP